MISVHARVSIIMTALFQKNHRPAESNLSRPFTRNAETKEDGTGGDHIGTYDARTSKPGAASSISSSTLKRMPSPKRSPGIYSSTSALCNESEDELLGGQRTTLPLVEYLDEFDAAPEKPNGHGLLDSVIIGRAEKTPRKTQMKEGNQSDTQKPCNGDQACENLRKLSPSQLLELALTPTSLPQAPPSPTWSPKVVQGSSQAIRNRKGSLQSIAEAYQRTNVVLDPATSGTHPNNGMIKPSTGIDGTEQSTRVLNNASRPNIMSRAVSTPASIVPGAETTSMGPRPQVAHPPDLGPPPLYTRGAGIDMKLPVEESCASPMPSSMPLPPFSLPTYLQLELSSNKPSPLYIRRSKTSEVPYEPSTVKIERLLNFLLLPPQLEQVLWFGTLACLDAFLYSFTILPLRFCKALFILAQSWGHNLAKEAQYVGRFIYSGAGRMWRRKRRDSMNREIDVSVEKDDSRIVNGEPVPMTDRFSSAVGGRTANMHQPHFGPNPVQSKISGARPRFESTPSALLPEQKADLLKGFLLILSCTILMHFDASRMYHGIRGQAAIKLYVIYNVLEVSR